MRSVIFFVEGVHDVNCVSKILFMEGFKELNRMSEIPPMWTNKIPRSYPFIDDRLYRSIPMPSFYGRNNLCVVIVSSNGSTNIINDMDLYLSNMTKSELKLLNSVCAIFDADENMANESFEKKFKKYNKDIVINKKDFLQGYFRQRGEVISLYYYVFPDNNQKGTLEDFLLEGASVVYKDLLDGVCNYLDSVDSKHKKNWSKSSENKVKVGCIGNIFQPGGANQVSIRYDDWISKESIEGSEIISQFYNFILSVIN